jgi:transcriptional regulator with XRE-family HTH domain
MIFNKKFPIVNNDYVKQVVVDTHRRETLAQIAKRVRLEKGFTVKSVAQKSGGRIAASYVSRIENGQITNPSPAKLKALAIGLDTPEDVIFAAVRGEPLDGKGVLSARFNSISKDIELLRPDDKAFILQGLEALHHHIQVRIASYTNHNLVGINGNKEINIRELVKAIQSEHPDFAVADILDIYYEHDVEKYDEEQIRIVRDMKSRFQTKNNELDALKTTG